MLLLSLAHAQLGHLVLDFQLQLRVELFTRL
jgi:hypothetical protein